MALKLKNGFNRMRDSVLSTRASQILAGMDGNPNFPNPTPTYADMYELAASFNAALRNCGEGDKVKIAIKNQWRVRLISALHTWSFSVLLASNNNEAIALSSGFEIAKVPSPAPPLEKPMPPELRSGINSGELICKGKRVNGAVSYLHQYTTEAGLQNDEWKTLPCSRATTVLQNLTPGVRYYCRLAVVGRREQLVYSDVVSRFAA